MSNRLDRQEATGRAFYMAGRGNLFGMPTHPSADSNATTGVPTNGIPGFAPGALFFNWLATGNSGSYLFVNIGTFASAQWLEIDGTSAASLLFGNGLAPLTTMGNLFKYADGTGVQPGSTAGDIVVLTYTLPANSLDGTGFRELIFEAEGNFAATGNNKTVKLFFNATTAVVGSAVTGGTAIATTGVSAGNNVGWGLKGKVWKYGAANSNTQLTKQIFAFVGGGSYTTAKTVNTTATENAAIIMAVTVNCATATTDCNVMAAEITGIN